jgi:uncharacterized protein YbjT (DUF2867 family)
MKTAIVLGATGLTGKALLSKLLLDSTYTSVKSFARKPIELEHTKLIQHTIDFNNLTNYKDLIKGDVVFCCLGTTIKTAGSHEAFKKVDFTYPTEFAKIAKQNNVPSFYLQSSLGADSKSNNFYLKVKGETEEAIRNLKFDSFATFRPSMLLGKREEFRFGEVIGKIMMKALSFIFIGKLKRYKAIHVNQVAEAMMEESKRNQTGNVIIENEVMVN